MVTAHQRIAWSSVRGWLVANWSHLIRHGSLLSPHPLIQPSWILSNTRAPWLGGHSSSPQAEYHVNLRSSTMENIRSWPVADVKVSVLYSTHREYEGRQVLWRNSAWLCQVQCSEILLKYFLGEWAGCIGFLQQILSNITDAAILSALIKPFKWITKTSKATGRNQTSLVVGFLLPQL